MHTKETSKLRLYRLNTWEFKLFFYIGRTEHFMSFSSRINLYKVENIWKTLIDLVLEKVQK